MKKLIILILVLVSNPIQSEDYFAKINQLVTKTFKYQYKEIPEDYNPKTEVALGSDLFSLKDYENEVIEIEKELIIYSLFNNFEYYDYWFREYEVNSKTKFELIIVFYSLY